jgi:glycosyltransferase involved in cell wall biosynthesis
VSRHLHFVQSLEPLQGGGLGASALGLHLAQGGIGISSRLVATCGAIPPGSWRGVQQTPRRGPAKAFYSPRLRSLAREAVGNAEIVHGHGFYTSVNWAFGREARRQGKPLAYHVQGFLDPWIRARSRLKKAVVHRLFENANFAHAGLWRALSRKEERQLRAFGIGAEIVVAPNGIDLAELDRNPGASELPGVERRRPRRLLFLGRLHPKKGLDLLISGWAKVASEFADWELLIVGPDEGGYQCTIAHSIARLATEDTCRILPAVSGELKNRVFRSADAFVLPSYSEGFPVAILEAAAHRLPVIMTDECNFPELAAAGAAWECRPEIQSLITALRTAMSADSTELQQRGEAGRQLIERSYTWDQIARQITEACAATLR